MSPGTRRRAPRQGPSRVAATGQVLAADCTTDEALTLYLPVPDRAAGRAGRRYLELPSGSFVPLMIASDEDFASAAVVARQRLGRCRRGSQTWHWYQAVLAEHERRHRGRLHLVPRSST